MSLHGIQIINFVSVMTDLSQYYIMIWFMPREVYLFIYFSIYVRICLVLMFYYTYEFWHVMVWAEVVWTQMNIGYYQNLVLSWWQRYIFPLKYPNIHNI